MTVREVRDGFGVGDITDEQADLGPFEIPVPVGIPNDRGDMVPAPYRLANSGPSSAAACSENNDLSHAATSHRLDKLCLLTRQSSRTRGYLLDTELPWHL
ncbi:hypothetical protein GCM10018783_18850 [Streptomyces griseosporeus]|nr:hypothetical protein GCM10018783_18850 [Streptomyces griseosporeus]